MLETGMTIWGRGMLCWSPKTLAIEHFLKDEDKYRYTNAVIMLKRAFDGDSPIDSSISISMMGQSHSLEDAQG
jgi:hypothetical protein